MNAIGLVYGILAFLNAIVLKGTCHINNHCSKLTLTVDSKLLLPGI